ncbi:hypothetical protein V1517DRAFT_318978 [Lipomyces orientalis]|uniref:Uncharacterized protein n=1 Tax=Lipomyces orientalis TaxID=1233043 RepID=A0ACC3TS80_9ASCO
MALDNLTAMSQPFPLTEENLQALLRSIDDSRASMSRSSSRTRDDNVSDIYSLDISAATDVLPGVRRVPEPPSTVDSTPQGSVVNFSARQAAARLSTTGRRPVQGNRHRRRLENARMLYNPHAVPPQPQDYLPTPTYAVRRIDRNLVDYLSTLRTKIPEDFMSLCNRDDDENNRQRNGRGGPHIPKTLKERVKKGHLTRPFLQALEEDIREFVLTVPARDGQQLPPAPASERNIDGRKTGAARQRQFLLEKEIPIVPDTDRAESFSRWIVYQIAEYYRISCYTKIVNDRRVPCVILNVDENEPFSEVPRPIWTYV